MPADKDLEMLCVNTIRCVSADQPQAANSGHPGAPMGCAPMAHLLWAEQMKYSSKDPAWINRDRFVLSNGHACALQYTMLHLTGYKVYKKDLAAFRKINSLTPGHPESFHTEGVEVCTGPLGQGITNAVGIAIAEKNLAANFNKKGMDVFDHYTFVICGDGCLQEGISGEASSLAGHLGLGKLIVMYDDNSITIDGETKLSFTEDVLMRYEAYGWHTQAIDTAEQSLDDLREAIVKAKKETSKPSIIKVKTRIGFGSPKHQGKESAHGAPLGVDDLKATKKAFGLPEDESFYVPDEVQKFYDDAVSKADKKRTEWEELFSKYSKEYPDEAAEISRRFANKLPDGIIEKLPKVVQGTDKNIATRKASQLCLESIGPLLPELIGGSADLTPSNLTNYKGANDFQKDTPEGRYLRFGVREHAMAAVCNGIFAHGGFIPFCATFLTFSQYAMGAIRLSALSKFGLIYIMTHDSIGIGEDGPTHQPVEHLESLRSMPNILVFRPADQNEMSGAYQVALTRRETPVVICCSRSNTNILEASTADKTRKGAYICVEESNPDLILVATGQEAGLCVDAAKKLKDSGKKVRVVSMPCQDLFLEQSADYQKSVLPGDVPTLSVEAASPYGWHRFSHAQIAVTEFGRSGNGEEVLNFFGFNIDNVAEKGNKLIEFYKDTPVPNLNARPIFDNRVKGPEMYASIETN